MSSQTLDLRPSPTTWVSTRWLTGPIGDTLFALLWVPFAGAALLAEGNPGLLTTVVGATLTFSFMHQPLTLCLVYGDTDQFEARRRLFLWSPLAITGLVLAGLYVAPLVVVLVAGVWNAAHTLRQRYGVSRIYGRMVGQTDGRPEQAMLWAWLALAVSLVAASPDLGSDIARSGVAGRNKAALEQLGSAGSVALAAIAVAGVLAVVLTVRWLRAEAALPQTNPAKWLYLASTAALLAVTVAHPVAGFVGYVGSHAAEYMIIVHRRLRRPSGAGSPQGRGALFSAVGASGPTGFIAAYLLGTVVLVVALDHIGSQTTASAIALVLGGLHLFQDGFIWKLRRPELARSLRISPATGD